MSGVLPRKEKRHKDRERERRLSCDYADSRKPATWRRRRDASMSHGTSRTADNTRGWKSRKDFPLQRSGESGPAHTVILDSQPVDWERINSHCFRHSHLVLCSLEYNPESYLACRPCVICLGPFLPTHLSDPGLRRAVGSSPVPNRAVFCWPLLTSLLVPACQRTRTLPLDTEERLPHGYTGIGPDGHPTALPLIQTVPQPLSVRSWLRTNFPRLSGPCWMERA